MKFPIFLIVVCFTTTALGQASKISFEPYKQIIPGSEVEFQMVPIEGGTFMMGSPSSDQKAIENEKPQRKVSVSSFWMGTYEVTHDEFDIFLKDENIPQNSSVDAITRPSPQYIDLTWGMGRQGGYPANSMQQMAALMYCRWLYKKTGIFYRLPTEAEWEYAARAGSTGKYYFEERDIDQYAWYKENSEESYQKAGQKKPNAWGLYDMLGNLAEWTLDQYDEDYLTTLKDDSKDPMKTPAKKLVRTARGGSYESEADELRVSARQSWKPGWNKRDPQIPKSKWWLTDAPFVGFRVIRPLVQPTPQEINDFFLKHINL